MGDKPDKREQVLGKVVEPLVASKKHRSWGPRKLLVSFVVSLRSRPLRRNWSSLTLLAERDSEVVRASQVMEFREALDELEGRVDLAREFDRCVRFMLAACGSLELAAVARGALSIAEGYLDGSVSEAELEQTRVACWESIRGRDSDVADREVAGTRAVICALFQRSRREDPYETLSAFADFAVRAGAVSVDLAAALRELD